MKHKMVMALTLMSMMTPMAAHAEDALGNVQPGETLVPPAPTVEAAGPLHLERKLPRLNPKVLELPPLEHKVGIYVQTRPLHGEYMSKAFGTSKSPSEMRAALMEHESFKAVMDVLIEKYKNSPKAMAEMERDPVSFYWVHRAELPDQQMQDVNDALKRLVAPGAPDAPHANRLSDQRLFVPGEQKELVGKTWKKRLAPLAPGAPMGTKATK